MSNTLASIAFKRTPLLTSSARLVARSNVRQASTASSIFTPTALRAFAPKPISKPTHNSTRTFSQTATMSKEGVHNLQNKADWVKAQEESKETVLVLDCFATWCGPCKTIAPFVVKLSEKYTTAKFYKIDVDELPDVAEELEIRAMPTFVIIKNGVKQDNVVGANPKALEDAIKQALPEDAPGK